MIRIILTRHDGKPDIVRRFEGDDQHPAAVKFLVEDSYFDNDYVADVIWQRLPDGPDVWPLPGYDQGYAAGSDTARQYLIDNPEDIPVHEQALNEIDALRARLAAAEEELAALTDPAPQSSGTQSGHTEPPAEGPSPARVLRVACDGSSLDNPGFAGWGWYVDEENWAGGGAERATNNAMELTALLEFLKAVRHLPSDTPIEAVLDSRYVIDTVTKWARNWRWNGAAYLKRDGSEAVNSGLIHEIMALLAERPGLGFRWVKGHQGDELNENADRVATDQAKAHRKGVRGRSGPGFAR